MTHAWRHPINAVRNGDFEIGERVIARLRSGKTVELEFTWLAYDVDPTDMWTGFAHPDGEEVLNADIKSVRAKTSAEACVAITGKDGSAAS